MSPAVAARAAAVPFQKPEPPPAEAILAYYALSEDSGWYANRGPCASLLAERLGSRLGVHALPVANGTLGLMVALRALLGAPEARRRRVVMPSYTCAATACAVVWAGFEPLFADLDPCSWQLDPGSLAAALAAHEGSVAGVLACSTFGTGAAERPAWRRLCADASVPLLVDSAAGLGSVDGDGAALGSGPEPEVFSFHATKPAAVGEGGALVSPDADLVERARRLASFGVDEGIAVGGLPGLNAKMSELHAAAALAMLDRLDDAVVRRQAAAARLRDALAHYPLAFQRGAAGSTWQALHVLLPDAAGRRRMVAAAGELGVEVRTLWDPPLHRQGAFAAHPRVGGLPVTDDVASRSLSLPLSTRLEADEVESIVAVAERTFGGR